MSSEVALLTKQKASLVLGSYQIASRLSTLGLLKPIPINRTATGWRVKFAASEIESLKPCLRTQADLERDGFADPVEGHLWIIELDNGNYKITDLCEDGWKGRVCTIPSAASKYQTSRDIIDRAVEQKLIQSRRVRSGWRIVLEQDVAQFLFDSQPKEVDPAKLQTASQLAETVGATDKAGRCEVTQCARLWDKMGWLNSKPVFVNEPGVIRRGAVVKAVRKNRQRTKYDVNRFLELWNQPLDDHVADVKKLVPKGQRVPVPVVREALEAKGLIGERFLRVIRLAGIGISRKGAHHGCFYERRHNGPTPQKKHRSVKSTADWLQRQLRRGAVLFQAVRDSASKRGIEKKSLRSAFKLLGCQRFWAPRNGRYATKGDVRLFWGLPGQEAPTPAEMQEAIGDYRRSAVVAATAEAHSSSVTSTTPTPPRGRRSAIAKHQRWKAEHDSGKSLGAIAKKEGLTRRAVVSGIAKARAREEEAAREVNSRPE